MLITVEILNNIEPGEIFRTVTTKVQRMYNPMNAELTFVCKRGHGHNDWAIYCYFSDKDVSYIAKNGNKVASHDIIQSICPCDEEAMKLYRH